MDISEETAEGIMQTVRNHIERATEGQQLLEEGKSLSEMKTKPTGLTPEQTIQRRQEYIDMINGMDNERLEKHLHYVEFQIQKRLEDPLVGSSELERQRNQINMLIEQRKDK